MIQIITNVQRKYFGLQEIDPNWQEFEVQSINFSSFRVLVYLDKNVIKKCIVFGDKIYKEMQVNETLTDDFSAIIRKDNGKTSSLDSIINKTALKMTILFDAPNITIYNESTKKTFYSNFFENKENLSNLDDFRAWADNWCNTQSYNEIEDMIMFSGEENKENNEYNEGDIFRIKFSRELYGYGKIILSYKKLRESNEKYWNCFMDTPVLASLYHILTPNKNLRASDLEKFPSFPSEFVAESNFITGNYKIVDKTKIDYKNEDYPIMYGREISKPNTTFYQNGKTFIQLENTKPLFNNYKFNSVLSNLGFNIDLMQKCIEEKSNLPYYQYSSSLYSQNDLRNPINQPKLDEVLKQLKLK